MGQTRKGLSPIQAIGRNPVSAGVPMRASPESTLRRVDPQFRVSLPPEVRQALNVKKDDLVVFEVKDGDVRIKKAKIVVE